MATVGIKGRARGCEVAKVLVLPPGYLIHFALFCLTLQANFSPRINNKEKTPQDWVWDSRA